MKGYYRHVVGLVGQQLLYTLDQLHSMEYKIHLGC